MGRRRRFRSAHAHSNDVAAPFMGGMNLPNLYKSPYSSRFLSCFNVEEVVRGFFSTERSLKA